ncbi:MAG: hypothetical protein IPP86_10240 [Bacteroidetes bacterium]|nr:hypothetical protein [Bacteroidota bacterium]
MKKVSFLFTFLLIANFAFAQSNKDLGKTVVIPCSDFHITRPLSEIAKEFPVDENFVYEKSESEDREGENHKSFQKQLRMVRNTVMTLHHFKP